MMAQVKSGDNVKVHYTGKLDDGSVFDSSRDGEPLEFQLGGGDVIPGFEEAVLGMSIGDCRSTKIAADQAYGPRREEMMMRIERDQIPPDMNPEVGQQVQVNFGNGQSAVVTITEVAETSVVLDANHPLAGQDLTFDIELMEIS
jgi:peptidylprolyl isomerase